MYRYTAERVIARPAADVFAYLCDVSRQTEWVHGVKQARWLNGGAGPGATAEQVMTFLGRTHTVTLRVAEFEQTRRIVFEKDHPFPIRFGFELEDDGGSTQVRYPVEMAPRGLPRLVIALFGHRINDRDLAGVARGVEAVARTP